MARGVFGSAQDITGQRFGRLVALRRVENPKDRGRHLWLVHCDCGAEKVIYVFSLLYGYATSCGCYRREMLARGRALLTKHGHATRGLSLTYRTWQVMKRRCHDPKCDRYAEYGAKGVTVCERWRNDFSAFLADVGERQSQQMSIDRIDNNRGYEPGNVRWATKTEQNYNRRSTVRLRNVDDQPMTVQAVADYLAMPRSAVYDWLRRCR